MIIKEVSIYSKKMTMVLDNENDRFYLIESIIESPNVFQVTYRTYNNKYECGGFKYNLWLKGANKENYVFVLGNEHSKYLAFDIKIMSYKADNKVSEKYRYHRIIDIINQK